MTVKAARNLRKHGVSFKLAGTIFYDLLALVTIAMIWHTVEF